MSSPFPPAVVETRAGSIQVDRYEAGVSLRMTFGSTEQADPKAITLALELWQVYRLARYLRERALAEPPPADLDLRDRGPFGPEHFR